MDLKKKALLDWIINFIQVFLPGHTIKIIFKEYKSDLIPTPTDIPQRSPLLLILFLFFISKLFETFNSN